MADEGESSHPMDISLEHSYEMRRDKDIIELESK